MAKKRVVSTTINGKSIELLCEPRQTLLEVLRDNLDLTGTKEGCSNGNCGACTVLMNGLPVYACSQLAVWVDGADVQTVEGPYWVLSYDGKATAENAALSSEETLNDRGFLFSFSFPNPQMRIACSYDTVSSEGE